MLHSELFHLETHNLNLWECKRIPQLLESWWRERRFYITATAAVSKPLKCLWTIAQPCSLCAYQQRVCRNNAVTKAHCKDACNCRLQYVQYVQPPAVTSASASLPLRFTSSDNRSRATLYSLWANKSITLNQPEHTISHAQFPLRLSTSTPQKEHQVPNYGDLTENCKQKERSQPFRRL